MQIVYQNETMIAENPMQCNERTNEWTNENKNESNDMWSTNDWIYWNVVGIYFAHFGFIKFSIGRTMLRKKK